VSTAPKKGKKSESGKTAWSDSRLVAECLQGKEAAWEALIDKYKNLIFSIPLRYGFGEGDAGDIFQAVCMDLLLELENLRKPEALTGWLMQVTRNKCFHRKKEQQRLRGEEVNESDVGADEATDKLLLEVEQEQFVRQAMTELSPRCKKLIAMLFFEFPARPYEEVAQHLKLAQGSIGFMRRRCLEKLRQQLEDSGFQ
jgi:RNA polymerase sigma factor (sigma-70 family)